MREIKFRVWCKQTETMNNVEKIRYDEGKLWYIEDEHMDTEPPYFVDDYNWDLMQYTGLKDKNGREIYEGDIVNRIEKTGYTFTGAVIYKECGFGIQPSIFFMPLSKSGKYDDGHSSFDYSIEYEIIGNIYENPELLEENK